MSKEDRNNNLEINIQHLESCINELIKNHGEIKDNDFNPYLILNEMQEDIQALVNSISKQVIEEKLETEKNKIEQFEGRYSELSIPGRLYVDEIDARIKILQELLLEGE